MISQPQPFFQVRENAHIDASQPLAQWYPFPWYRVMREQAPVYYDESLHSWSFFRYEDINPILHDYEAFSSQLQAEAADDDTMLTLDPPRHHQLRGLVSQAFTPRMLSQLTPRITQIIDEILDQVTQSTHTDAVAAIGFPFPSAVIAEMLGVPREDRDILQEWTETVMVEQSSAMRPISPKAGQAYLYLQDLVKKRQRNPGEDMISQLIRAQIDGKHLDFTEIVTFCSLLYFAGYETTINLIGNSFLCARGNGEVDIVQDIAYPLPATVMSELLGVPEEDRPLLKAHIDATTQRRDEKQAGFVTIPDVFHDYFVQTARERRQTSKVDLISDLVHAQAEGEQLDDAGIARFSALLYTAGHVTTTDLISNTFLCFEDFPEAKAQVMAQPELLPGATEEVLRYCSSVQAFPRRLTKDIELRGQQLHAGDLIIIWNGSANHDELAFPDPERFDVQRSPNRHIAFGHGIHFCLGAPLARLETPIAVQAILERLPNLERIGEVDFTPIGPLITFGPKNLKMRFTHPQ